VGPGRKIHQNLAKPVKKQMAISAIAPAPPLQLSTIDLDRKPYYFVQNSGCGPAVGQSHRAWVFAEHGSVRKKEEKDMKKLMVLAFGLLLLSACAGHSEFWSHNSMYASFDHMKFSMSGYQNPTAESGALSTQQGWWGEEIPYIPAK
jgi:hypothetical protein